MSALVAIEELVLQARGQFEAVTVDTSITFERESGFAIQLLMASEFAMKTALTNKQSVINAVANIAAIGLSLNPARKQAYLVPRDGKICLDISYMGLLDLAIDSGSVRWGQAELVYETDTFELDGIDRQPIHRRQPFAKGRGAVVGTYVVVKTATGDYLTTAMSIAEVYDIRNRSRAWIAYEEKGKKCPWATDEGEMVKKTVIKRAYKTWPKSEGDRLHTAIHHLNEENDEGLPPIDNEPDYRDPFYDFTPSQAKKIREVAQAAIQAFNEGNEYTAYEEYITLLDKASNAETRTSMQLAMNSIFRPHSALRSALKRFAEEQRARAKQLETMADGSDPALLAKLQASIDMNNKVKA